MFHGTKAQIAASLSRLTVHVSVVQARVMEALFMRFLLEVSLSSHAIELVSVYHKACSLAHEVFLFASRTRSVLLHMFLYLYMPNEQKPY